MRLKKSDARRLGIPWDEPATKQAAAAERPRTLLPPGPPGRWEVTLGAWVPPSLNTMLGRHWGVTGRRKKLVAHRVGIACLAARVSRAQGMRRVSLEIRCPLGRKHPDGDNVVKCVYDSLTACGAIVDDGPAWFTVGPYVASRGRLATILVIEDLEGGPSQ